MRIPSCALIGMLGAVILSTHPALADPACPPGAFCEELPEDPDAPAEGDTAEPDDAAEPDDVEEPEALESTVAPLVEPEPTPPLASERASWVPEDGDAPRPADPTYGNDVESAGLGIFATTYGIPFFIGLVAAAAADENPDAAPLIPLLVPVAGPLITGAIYDVGPEGYGLLAAAGGVQAVGLIIWAIGASLPNDPHDTATVRPTANGLMVSF